jgi:hypothetical protein
MSNKIYDWRELQLQSLDLILCKGKSKLSRYIQKTQEFAGADKSDAEFTHVASVKRPMFDDHWFDLTFSNTGIFVQESTTLNKFSGKKGVQLNPFDLWLENYNGEVYIRKLDFTRTVNFHHYDDTFWYDVKNTPYESGIPGGIELLLCAMRLHRYIPWYTPMKTKEIHCTELNSNRLARHDLFECEVFPNRMPPCIWPNQIEDYLRCDIGGLIRIK